jgi:hypothetical protein
MEKQVISSLLREKTLNFAVRIVELNKYLVQKKMSMSSVNKFFVLVQIQAQ